MFKNSKFLPKINNQKASTIYNNININKSFNNKSNDNIEYTNGFDIKSDRVFITSKQSI